MAHLAAKAGDTKTGRYLARHFAAPPTAEEAVRLLDEIASTPPDFPTVPSDRPLALYGAGNLGQMAKEFLAEVGRDFDFVIDRNATTLADHPLWRDKPVYAPDAVPAHLKASHLVLVTVVTAPYVPLEAMLDDLGFEHIAPFYDYAEQFRDVHSLSNGWYAPVLSADDRDSTVKMLAGFADDISRALHLQFLAWRQLRQEWIFEGTTVANPNRFFIDEVMDALNANPVFVDGGAHHGSVSLTLAGLRPSMREIIAVEPDAANRTVLETTFRDRWPEGGDIRIISDALGAEQGEARFHSGVGYASQISPIGQGMVPLTTLDALDLTPDFVKLHLEGGELNALKGGLETFTRTRPIITATVYHNADGLFKTPLWLMENLADYRIVFRTHSWCGTGAVVYAIPNEKTNI